MPGSFPCKVCCWVVDVQQIPSQHSTVWQMRQGTNIHQAFSLCKVHRRTWFPGTHKGQCWATAGFSGLRSWGTVGGLSIRLREKEALLSWDYHLPTFSVLKWPFSMMLMPEESLFFFSMFVFGNTRLICLMFFTCYFGWLVGWFC